MTEADAKRMDRQAAVTAAWAELALNKSFKVVFEDAQLRFGMLSPSFVATARPSPPRSPSSSRSKKSTASKSRRLTRATSWRSPDSPR